MLTTTYSIYPIKKSEKFTQYMNEKYKNLANVFCEIEVNSIGVIKKFTHSNMQFGGASAVIKKFTHSNMQFGCASAIIHTTNFYMLVGSAFESLSADGHRDKLLIMNTKSGIRAIPVSKEIIKAIEGGDYDSILESDEPITNMREFFKVITI